MTSSHFQPCSLVTQWVPFMKLSNNAVMPERAKPSKPIALRPVLL
ncbi:hypothetical protein AB0M50_28055 [Nonomuraea fuscirosea]